MEEEDEEFGSEALNVIESAAVNVHLLSMLSPHRRPRQSASYWINLKTGFNYAQKRKKRIKRLTFFVVVTRRI